MYFNEAQRLYVGLLLHAHKQTKNGYMWKWLVTCPLVAWCIYTLYHRGFVNQYYHAGITNVRQVHWPLKICLVPASEILPFHSHIQTKLFVLSNCSNSMFMHCHFRIACMSFIYFQHYMIINLLYHGPSTSMTAGRAEVAGEYSLLHWSWIMKLPLCILSVDKVILALYSIISEVKF